MKNRLSIILLSIIILNLVIAGNVFAATEISATGYNLHSGWAPNIGARSINVHTSYLGTEYEQNGFQFVDTHDFIVSVSHSYGPEFNNGNAYLQSLQLYNSRDQAVGPNLKTVNFNSGGLYRNYYFNPAHYYILMGNSNVRLEGPSGSNKAKVATLYENATWFFLNGSDYYSSSSF